MIRTDSSRKVGSGHVMRCKTLADELRRRNKEVFFVCREEPGHLIALLRNNGYKVHVLSAQSKSDELCQEEDAEKTAEALEGINSDYLVVDHYGLDAQWERRLRPYVDRMLVIDDLANRPHDCDVLLDQNEFGDATPDRYGALIATDCSRLLGPHYALLPPLFAALRASLPPREGSIQRVLLFFGAVDSHGQTVKALQALDTAGLRDLSVDIVVGHANPLVTEIMRLANGLPCARVHAPLPTLAGLMARADLMLSAGGAVTWERCCLALPSIVTIAAENQKRSTFSLASKGALINIGEAQQTSIETWRQAISDVLYDKKRIQAVSHQAANICDGLGAKRVSAFIDNKPMLLRMRRAVKTDESLLFEWINDSKVRHYAFNRELITAESHHQWFIKKLLDPATLILIGEDIHGVPVGQVRIEIHDNEAVIDISVDRMFRRRGVGERLLCLAVEHYFDAGRTETLVAKVMWDNQASFQLFQRAGFRLSSNSSSSGDNYHRFVLMR